MKEVHAWISSLTDCLSVLHSVHTIISLPVHAWKKCIFFAQHYIWYAPPPLERLEPNNRFDIDNVVLAAEADDEGSIVTYKDDDDDDNSIVSSAM